MPHTTSRRRPSAERWGVAVRAVPNQPTLAQQGHDDLQEVMEGLDQIPQLMHQANSSTSGDFWSNHNEDYLVQEDRTRKTGSSSAHSTDRVGNYTLGGPPPHSKGSSYLIYGASSSAPPPRALELVKEEVHRALKAFSTRPMKGEPQPPLPSDLLKPFDVSKDGQVTYPEFKAGLRGLRLGLTADEAEELACDVDGEGTGLVNRQRFEKVAVEDWGRGRGPSTAAAAHQSHDEKEISLDENTQGDRDDCVRWRVAPRAQQQHTDEMADDDGMHGVDHAAAGGGRGVGTSFRSMTAEETGDCAQRRDDDIYAGHVLCDKDGKGKKYALQEPPSSPGESPRPPTPPLRITTANPQGPSSGTPSSGQPRCSPTVSFDCWRRMTDSREGGGEGATPAANFSRGQRSRTTTCSNTHKRRTKESRHSHQTRQDHALATLRSLLERDGLDSGNYDASRLCRRSTTTNTSWRDNRECFELNHAHERGEESHREVAAGSIGTGGAVAEEERRHAVNRGRGLQRGDNRVNRPSSAPAGSRACGEGKREREEAATGRARKRDDTLASQPDVERARRHTARAESILRLRSRGDLVGLRRSLSKADPSASGVVSRREMEHAILRRFGTGLGHDESKELAARYHKDFNGRAMVDYGRLVDTLEAMEAGLLGWEVRGVGGSSERWSRELDHKRHQSGGSSIASQKTSPGNCAPGRGRTSCQRYCMGYEWADGCRSRSSIIRVPEEDSQLVRRARSKTLALLDQHGTRRADCIFRLVDPAHTESLTAKQLRESLRILGGTDPLTDIEHQALFRDVSGGEGRVKYRDLLDTLRASEAVENRERTQRKLIHQAGLPTRGRGSAKHWRHSDVLDWDVPLGDETSPSHAGISGGRQHPESRRHALVFQRLRDSVKKIQEDRGRAGPVFDMFCRGGGGGGGGGGRGINGAGKNTIAAAGENGRCSLYTPHRLPPAALRAGLRSLGIPLGDSDFTALVASVDPKSRGQVSYANFCDGLKLHQLRGDYLDKLYGAKKRRSSSVGVSSSQVTGKTSEAAAPDIISDAVDACIITGGRTGGGAARRMAMELAPDDSDQSLEGGVFHRNPATDGCANPNFTTTMFAPRDERGKRKDARVKAAYHPTRRPSSAPASGTRYAETRPEGHGQHMLLVASRGASHPPLWQEAGVEAENTSCRGLSVKTRRPRSHSSSSRYAGARGPYETSRDSPDKASLRRGSDIDALTASNASSGNRRGRGSAPRNNDLGFGSERMRSASRGYDSDHRSCRGDVSVSGGDGRRSSTRDVTGASSVDSRRTRSLSLGAERRYGNWARSSVQQLLRHDYGWLGVRSSPNISRPVSARDNASDRAVMQSRVEHGMSGLASGAKKERTRRHQDSSLTTATTGHYGHDRLRNYSRHPAQVTQRGAIPYATDADGVLFSPKEGGVRSGGGDRRSRGTMRERSKTAAAAGNPAAPSARTRDQVRVSSDIETLGLRGRKNGQLLEAVREEGATSYAAAGAQSRGESWRRRNSSSITISNNSNIKPRNSGWSAEAYGGRELSPTLRWDDSRVFPVG